jgi:hypothetical protein
MDDRLRLEIEWALLCARIELEGMLAENKQREMNGEALAYSEQDIRKLINDYGLGHNSFY